MTWANFVSRSPALRHRDFVAVIEDPQNRKSGHMGRFMRTSKRTRGGGYHRDPLTETAYQVQVIWPPADDEQVFVVSECDAAADHVAGGPASAVAVTVTLPDGRKP